MKPVTIKDNSSKPFSELNDQERKDLDILANRTIDQLAKKDGLLVFPPSLGKDGEKLGDKFVLQTMNDRYATGNIMGFVGVGDTRLRICSRFGDEGGNDFFLHYMLQRVFAVNLFDLQYTTAEDEVFDFLLYLFPRYLGEALRQGVFKQYQTRRHDDANVRGTINVPRHIRRHVPFAGRVAYDTREHSHDNAVTQLVRHTIEHIARHPFGRAILTANENVIENVSQIRQATPSYRHHDRQRVIRDNLRPRIHPFYTAYLPLQRLCLQILRHEQLQYGQRQDEIHGILFDGAWLWEEYLNTILRRQGFRHPQNTLGKAPIYAFTGNHFPLYPDFYRNDMVLDAKYKRYEDGGLQSKDLHQIISYMYLLRLSKGGFIVPSKSPSHAELKGTLHGHGGTVTVYGLQVAHSAPSFSVYCEAMAEAERLFVSLEYRGGSTGSL